MSETISMSRINFVRRWWRKCIAFVAEPASPRPLAVLRIGVAVVLLGQAAACAGSLLELYGNQGIIPWSVNESLNRSSLPRVSWLANALAPFGVSADATLYAVFAVYLLSLGGLWAGWRTRWMALAAWLTHMALNKSGYGGTYGVDAFAHIALFYCVLMPVGEAFSLDVRAGRASGRPSAGARLALRVLQIHLCMVYLSTAIFKATSAQWWNGEAIWRAVMQPDFKQFDLEWLAAVPWVAQLVCWGTLVVEGGYAVFVWPHRTRRPWALAIVGLHAGIAVMLGLWSFSGIMIVLTGSAFLVSSEPKAEAEETPRLRAFTPAPSVGVKALPSVPTRLAG